MRNLLRFLSPLFFCLSTSVPMQASLFTSTSDLDTLDAIQTAIEKNWDDCLTQLVNNVEDEELIHACNERGESFVFKALATGKIKAVEILLANGADLDDLLNVNNEGLTALEIILKKKPNNKIIQELVRFLQKHPTLLFLDLGIRPSLMRLILHLHGVKKVKAVNAIVRIYEGYLQEHPITDENQMHFKIIDNEITYLVDKVTRKIDKLTQLKTHSKKQQALLRRLQSLLIRLKQVQNQLFILRYGADAGEHESPEGYSNIVTYTVPDHIQSETTTPRTPANGNSDENQGRRSAPPVLDSSVLNLATRSVSVSTSSPPPSPAPLISTTRTLPTPVSRSMPLLHPSPPMFKLSSVPK